VPEALRIDAHYKSTVIEGPLAGGMVRGVDYLLIRSDGVSVLDAREAITTAAGQQIAARAQGHSLPGVGCTAASGGGAAERSAGLPDAG
jgi:hypothetical protein